MRPKSETSDLKLLVTSKSISYFRNYGTDKNVSATDSKIVSTPEKRNSISAKKQHYIVYRVLENSIQKC